MYIETGTKCLQQNLKEMNNLLLLRLDGRTILNLRQNAIEFVAMD